MDDRQVEDLLKRYQPMAPPAALRERCLLPLPHARVWPWAAAAAALLAITVGLQAASASAMAGIGMESEAQPGADAVADLAAALGGDSAATQLAEQFIDQQLRRDREQVARSASPMGEVP